MKKLQKHKFKLMILAVLIATLGIFGITGINAASSAPTSFTANSEKILEIVRNKLKQDGIDFAIIRVGYRGYGTGKIVMDPCFKKNIEGALANNIHVGVYFYSVAKNEMEKIINYMDTLNQLDTTDMEAMSHAFPVKNVFREDVVMPSTDREIITSNAPNSKDGCFVVPRTFE